MDVLWHEITTGLPDFPYTIRIVLRILTATVAGAIVGYQRERTGKAAGLRTHMLVALSSALFVIAPVDADYAPSDVSRVIQGVAAGIGFLGAGTIIKLTAEGEVRGLTTAAGIWLTAAVGVCAGLGRIGLAMISAVLAWLILAAVARIERRGGDS